MINNLFLRSCQQGNYLMLHILQNQIVLNQQLDCRKLSQMVDVSKILKNVSENGDQAIINYMKEFDGVSVSSIPFPIGDFTPKEKSNNTELLQATAENIRKFHQRQFPASFTFVQKDGTCAEWKWRPIERVGIYVPGGRFSLVSSLLMNVIPAQVAGVKEIAVCTPPNKNGLPNASILNACKILSINEIYSVGGAQAIAALTYGTQTIKSVSKIFGPGNAYVAAAKKQVFGKVGIDLVAGPSEIIVVADDENNPEWVASDIMAQAEHDENAQSILITNSNAFANKVLAQIEKLKKTLSKKITVEISLKKNGLIVIMDDLKSSHKIINKIAPEHLHLQSKEKEIIFKNVNNAGGIFLGDYSTEAFGDYVAGTNHILPTSGAAKFSSGLGVIDFMKKNSVVEINKLSYENLSKHVENISDVENLDAHKLSVTIRQTKQN